MNYNISFELSAILFLGMLLLYMGLQYDLKIKVNGLFFKLAVLVLFTNALDIITAVAIDNYKMVDPLLNTILSLIYYMVAGFSAFYVYYFMLIYRGRKDAFQKLTRTNIIVMSLYAVLLIVNIFTDVLYAFVIESGYVQGPLFVLCIFVPVYFILCAGWVFISHYPEFPDIRCFVVLISLIVACSGFVIQFGWYPDILLSAFTPAMGMVLMMIFLETPDAQKLKDVLKELEQAKEETENFESEMETVPENEASGFTLYAPKTRILVVDDNRMDLDNMCDCLKDTSITVDKAQNGEEARLLLQKMKYDMVFLDQIMPIMDGVETLKLLLDEHLCEDNPVIVMIANETAQEKEDLLAAGFTDYMMKPVNPQQLLIILKKYLSLDLLEDRKEGF